jgi:hypothetical protein
MKINFFPKNNRGWIKIVEAFVAILLIAGVLLFILDKGYIKKDDPSEKIYNVENSILREIQNNDSIRIEILNQTLIIPIESNDSLFPEGVKTIINIERPSYLNCKAKICSLNDDCLLSDSTSIDVYARSVPITSTITNYNPRQLKIFCW